MRAHLYLVSRRGCWDRYDIAESADTRLDHHLGIQDTRARKGDLSTTYMRKSEHSTLLE